jgi:Pyruvate/2-oxoacid:ferredoxin oxidoreductase gamma subunit
MEEPEVPLESVQEHLEHHAHESKDKFISGIALSTAILAAFAAVTSLLAGDHANEAMIGQIESSDQWAFYQAKSIKSSVLSAKIAMLEAAGRAANPKDEEKLADYGKEQAEIQKEAEKKHEEATTHLHKHKLLAGGVTLLQIAIAVGAISALTRRRAFWVVSLLFGAIGVSFLFRELLL